MYYIDTPGKPETAPRAVIRSGEDHEPVLLSGRLHGAGVQISWSGADRTYQLHAHTPRASRLAPGALVYVRISKANPAHAEVYEPGIAGHRFLGHALFTASRPG